MGEVIVIAEHRQQELREITLQMLWKANELCENLSHDLTAVLIAGEDLPFINEITEKVDRLIVIKDERLKDFNSEFYKEIIEKISLELNWVKREPPPKVVVRSFGDSAVNLEARVWIREPRRRMDTISHITDRVKEVFQQERIEIPFPKRDIYIKREA